jgi:3-methyladenine DNA glycosylase AlkD
MLLFMGDIAKELLKMRDKPKAKFLAGFFKTGKGEYGEGDCFLGITVPMQRMTAKKHHNASFDELDELLSSKYHEFRLTAVIILVLKYEKGSDTDKKRVFNYYIRNRNAINNWDIVDVSAHKIVGDYVLNYHDNGILYRLASSGRMWDRRIAMVSCLAFIRNNKFDVPLDIAEKLLHDRYDLMHKAVGWMLREIGKRDERALTKFLDAHAAHMPRTSLRYSVERLEQSKRNHYMGLKKSLGS